MAPPRKKVFKISLGHLPGCTKNCFSGFVVDHKNVFKEGGMYDGFVKQMNNSNWSQKGYTAKEFNGMKEVVPKLFREEYANSQKDGDQITAEACFKVELWALSDAEEMLVTLKEAEHEGRNEEEIISVLDGFVRKLHSTKKDVADNNPLIKYELDKPKEENGEEMAQGEVVTKPVEDDEKEEATALMVTDVPKNGVKENISSKEIDEKNLEIKKENDIQKQPLAKQCNSADSDAIEDETVASLQLKIEGMDVDLRNKEKMLNDLADKVKEREDEIGDALHRNQVLEEKLHRSSSEKKIKDDVEDIKEDVKNIKAGINKVLEHMGEDLVREEAPKKKLAEVMGDINVFIKKQLKNPSMDDVKNKVKDNAKKIDKIGIDVNKSTQIVEELATSSKDNHEVLVELIGKMEISAGSSASPYKKTLPIHTGMPKTDTVAVIGDRILHHMMNFNPPFRYDLMSGSYDMTGYNCSKKDLVRMGTSLGLWLENIPKETETIVISFGLDDTLLHPDVELQRKQKSLVDNEELIKVNKDVIVAVAENCVKVIEMISQKFPNARITYVLPPPSESEPVVVDQLRKELKAAWQRGRITSTENSKASYIDGAACLANIRGLEKAGMEPGHLSWEAGVRLAKEIYSHLFPDSIKRFSTCCSSIHIEGMCNKDRFGQSDTDFGKNGACSMCNSKEHFTRNCPVKDFFRESRVNCGHCGCLSASLNHHPDNCHQRFSWCPVCHMYGHIHNVHRTPPTLRIASTRLGSHGLPFNKIDPTFDKKKTGSGVADIVDITDVENTAPAAKKAKLEVE